jgi:hypothetical protein
MSSTKPDPLGPYATPEELSRGRRRAAVHLAIAVAALCLALVADRAVGDPRLVQTYLLAAILFLLTGLGPVIRISRTQEPEPAD